MWLAQMQNIPKEMYESADLDGANSVQKSFYVTLPAISGLIIIMTILKIGGIMRADFGLFYQISRDTGALYARTDVIDTYVFRTSKAATTRTDPGYNMDINDSKIPRVIYNRVTVLKPEETGTIPEFNASNTNIYIQTVGGPNPDD